MIATVAANTLRECFRRPFPYVVGVAVVLLALASRFFLAFSFGAEDIETVNLGISAVFLAGFAHAAFQGTALVRRDLERGTLGLLLAKPVDLPGYVAGRFVGVAIAAILLCAGVAVAVAAIFSILPAPGEGAGLSLWSELLSGCLRAVLLVLILEAAALAASAALPRVAAPIALIGVFLAGSLIGAGAPGVLLPDFSLFGLEAGAATPWLPLVAYALVYVSIFLVLAFIVLASKPPLRSQS